MTKAEEKAYREILAVAAEYILSDWGEPLKDADIPDEVDNDALTRLQERVARDIKALGKP